MFLKLFSGKLRLCMCKVLFSCWCIGQFCLLNSFPSLDLFMFYADYHNPQNAEEEKIKSKLGNPSVNFLDVGFGDIK